MRDRVVSEDSEDSQALPNREQWSDIGVVGEYFGWVDTRLRSNRLQRSSYARAYGRRLFGDMYGLTLFIGALAFFMFYWRIGFLINDSYTVANGLVAVSEGHLDVQRAVYGLGLDTPGMTEINGNIYARNYGQIVFALPFLWLIQGLAAIADLRVALAGVWVLLLSSLGLLVGRLVDREYRGWNSRSVGAYVGSAVAILAFVLVIRGATPIEAKWHHLIALQLQTMVAAGFLGVVIYRLLTRMYDRRTGLAAGGLVVFASPISLWAIFPKRHVLVSLAVFISIYCLFRSREARGQGTIRTVHVGGRTLHARKSTVWRAAQYVPVGLITWVNPIEGFLLLVGLLSVDISTGGIRIRAHLTAVSSCVGSLFPFFITNMLITGNPLEPPSTHLFFGSSGVAGQSQSGGSGGGGGRVSSGSTGGGTGEAVSSTPLDSFFGALSVASDYIDKGITVLSSDFDTLLYVFVQSGYVADLKTGGDALRLSYLEAMPVAAVLTAVPVIFLRCDVKGRIRKAIRSGRISTVATVDLFVVIYALLVMIVYVPRLPMQAEVTIRYLLVLFPLTGYGMMRVPSVRRVVRERSPLFCSAYLAGVMIGGQVLFLYIYYQGATIDEGFKIHSYVGLGLATLIAGWVLVDAVGSRHDRVGAILLGLGAAASTVFVLVINLWFSFGGNTVPMELF